MQVRRSQDRGHSRYSWLDSRHSFSFADYYDPEHMGFSVLRVINDDEVAPGAGFPTHGHRDMEIISYILQGSIEHKDSMGHVSQLKAGEAQRMSAGTGVRHSEYNPSSDEPLHFLQIWIQPDQLGIEPGYEQLRITSKDAPQQLQLLVSPDGRGDSMHIHQDVLLYSSHLAARESLDYVVNKTRKTYLHVVAGKLVINEFQLNAGDATSIENETQFTVAAEMDSEFLLFDLP